MSTAPLLSAAYANSPVNTSPPFAPTVEHVSLYEATRAKATELTDAAARLQKVRAIYSRCDVPEFGYVTDTGDVVRRRT